MNGKRYAIPDRVAALALKYGHNVSKGILEMNRLLDKYYVKPEGESENE